MELQFKEKELEVVMEKGKFVSLFKKDLSILKAITGSCSITYNPLNITPEKAWLILFGETNWGFFLSSLLNDSKDKIMFKAYNIEFKDRIDYVSDERTEGYTYLKLSPVKKSGKGYIVINDLIKTPEAFIDNWLQKKLYNYAEKDFKKVIYEVR